MVCIIIIIIIIRENVDLGYYILVWKVGFGLLSWLVKSEDEI